MADYLGNYTGQQIDSILNDADQNTYRKTEVDNKLQTKLEGVQLVEITPSNPATTAKSYKLQVKNSAGTFVDVSGSTIDIPKDKVITSGQVRTATVANVPLAGLQVGDAYLEFTIDGATSPMYVSVASIAGSKAASDISFVNAGSGLASTNVQAALVEIKNLASQGGSPAASAVTFASAGTGLASANVQAAIAEVAGIANTASTTATTAQTAATAAQTTAQAAQTAATTASTTAQQALTAATAQKAATDVTFNNAGTGLTATTVQAAIAEVASSAGSGGIPPLATSGNLTTDSAGNLTTVTATADDINDLFS